MSFENYPLPVDMAETFPVLAVAPTNTDDLVSRNARGLIGPVPKSEIEPMATRKKLADSDLVADKKVMPVDPALFNGSFVMHTSTSPQYSFIASTDVSARMMDHSGEYLTEAIAFRQAMVRLEREIKQRSSKDWWFGVWQPDKVGNKTFANVDPEVLRTRADVWELKPNADWHGFGDLGKEYCMLDPIKVTVLVPGLSRAGNLERSGIPAPLVSLFLESRGIVVEKTEPYSFLVLFSLGITKGKWSSLITGLMDFKRAYDANTPLEDALPGLASDYPASYGEMGLRDLADEMHAAMGETHLLELMDAAFTVLPDAVMHSRDTYAELVPYPPGILLMMPGERVSEKKRAVVDYLLALQNFDGRFPGFEHDIHGVEIERRADGNPVYMTYCLCHPMPPTSSTRC